MAIRDRLNGVESNKALKHPVIVASTGPLTLSSSQTIDGIGVVEGDRVLVKDQASAIANGIYTVDPGPWPRAVDFDSRRDLTHGSLVYVVRGSAYGNTFWVVSSSNPLVPDTDSIEFSQVNLALLGASTLGSSLVTLETGADVRAAVGAVGSAYLRVFSTSATWSKPTGLIGALVEVQGGGGGGGGMSAGSSAVSGGGGAGGYARGYLASSDLDSTIAVTVGAGGAFGATSTGATNGGTGGTSSFSTHLSATGGGGGAGSTVGGAGSGGQGGVGSGGALNVRGGGGQSGNNVQAHGGAGGASYFGGAGSQGYGTTGSSGDSGGGGGGAGGNARGGVGGPGIVAVLEFTSTASS